MDKRFFDLIFTPFFSCAMLGTDCHIRWEDNIKITADRVKSLPDKIKREMVAGLKAEIQKTQQKLPSIPKDLQIDFQLKIEAIKKLLLHV